MTTDANITTAGTPQVSSRYSNNWCGYMVTGEDGFCQSVSAQWQMPGALDGPSDDYCALIMLNDTSEPPEGKNLLASPGLFGDIFTVTWHNFGSLRT